MLEALKIIIENEPDHFWNTWNMDIPESVKLKWLSRFVKRNISKEIFIDFMNHKGWYKNVEEYKKSTHFKIINQILKFDIIPYYNYYNNINSVEFNREFKIWQLNRD